MSGEMAVILMSNSKQVGGKAKNNAHRRIWTKEEDMCMTQILPTVHHEGKYKEGDFKPGYLLELENRMTQKVLESSFEAIHIDSRLSYLKRQFYALHEITEKCNGFGWDNEQTMITDDRTVFNE
ncbi:hypothetical protein GH714_034951 [Hevea brasiliensis]|uniref:Myb/SANT-like domain-containing protein n=1 Tax=Hevea brasiliensis TaxID=3981 RepID=A0A6A6KK50_HEVBR|nr:hypothetical protein GH714_034951 [Hevea brasiliensis]